MLKALKNARAVKDGVQGSCRSTDTGVIDLFVKKEEMVYLNMKGQRGGEKNYTVSFANVDCAYQGKDVEYDLATGGCWTIAKVLNVKKMEQWVED